MELPETKRASKRLIDLNPAEYNPRVQLVPGMPAYEKLKASILKFGCVEDIVWNEKTGNVVGGHQRLQVLRDMAIDDGTIQTSEVDVVVVSLSKKDEKVLNLALNKITGLWDDDKLGALLRDIKDPFDLELTGFEEFELMEFTSDPTVQDQLDPSVEQQAIDSANGCLKAYNVIISCMDDSEQEWCKTLLKEDGRLKRQYTVSELRERLG